MNNLSSYIREDQSFLIFIFSKKNNWEIYNSKQHGNAKNITKNYVVTYLDGAILANTMTNHIIPEKTYYIEEQKYKYEEMTENISDLNIEIVHTDSIYHPDSNYYCTSITNNMNEPFQVERFAAFKPYKGKYILSTVSNDWFNAKQFRFWYNQTTKWIMPGETVIDYDNYGREKGYWVFDIKLKSGEKFTIKSAGRYCNSEENKSLSQRIFQLFKG